MNKASGGDGILVELFQILKDDALKVLDSICQNRIVAALSRGVLAVEAPVQSGTLITCAFAKELGRPVMAVPANLDSKNSAGCWRLIREGAKMVTSVADVVASVPAEPRAAAPLPARSAGKQRQVKETSSSAPAQLTLEEASVLRAVPSGGITLDRLAFAVKLPAQAVGAAAMSLRLKGLLRFMPGNRVAPAK